MHPTFASSVHANEEQVWRKSPSWNEMETGEEGKGGRIILTSDWLTEVEETSSDSMSLLSSTLARAMASTFRESAPSKLVTGASSFSEGPLL